MSDRAKAEPSTTPILTVTEGRALLRLNRPAEHNRIEPADLAALVEIFDRVDKDASIRVLVLTGTGKSFSSGFHIGALAERKSKGFGKLASTTPTPSRRPSTGWKPCACRPSPPSTVASTAARRTWASPAIFASAYPA